MTLRAGTYCRFSCDKQSDLSSEDQLRLLEVFAANDYTILYEHCYKDDAISGASAANRPGLQALLKAARRKPKPFDVVLVESTSRSSRYIGDTFNILRELNYLGIEIIWVSEGFKSTDANADELLLMHSGHNQATRKKISRDTHRGLSGQIGRGYSAGGRTYGYDLIPTPKPLQSAATKEEKKRQDSRLQINPEQAAVLRHMYELRKAGHSYKGIGRKLTAEKCLLPRPYEGRAAGWHHTAIREMLRNETYIGVVWWNRTRWITSPEGKPVPRPRPASEWRRVEHPELRIIDDALWQAVQQRNARRREQFGRGGGRYGSNGAGNPRGLGRGAEHLLTGFLKCGVCGGSLTILSGYGAGRNPRYGCTNHAHRGSCSNDLRESEAAIGERLFAKLQAAVLTDEIVSFAIEEFEKELKGRLAHMTSHLDRDRKREADLQGELQKLTAFILAAREGDDLDPIRDAINEKHREVKAIRDRILGAGRDSVRAEIGDVRELVTGELMKLRELLNQDVAEAKVWMREHLESITMMPAGEGKNRYYVASGGWNLLGGGENQDVAGGGFEPTTFGL